MMGCMWRTLLQHGTHKDPLPQFILKNKKKHLFVFYRAVEGGATVKGQGKKVYYMKGKKDDSRPFFLRY
jgi:hypothetical protein